MMWRCVVAAFFERCFRFNTGFEINVCLFQALIDMAQLLEQTDPAVRTVFSLLSLFGFLEVNYSFMREWQASFSTLINLRSLQKSMVQYEKVCELLQKEDMDVRTFREFYKLIFDLYHLSSPPGASRGDEQHGLAGAIDGRLREGAGVLPAGAG